MRNELRFQSRPMKRIHLTLFALILSVAAGPVVSAQNATESAAPAPSAAPTPSPAPAAGATPATNAAPPASTAPATNAAPASPGGGAGGVAEANIRFEFGGMPYMDVIQRFAQMVNKPLIVETNVEGTLTFTDPQPYTYGEAIDTLNLMLSMKDATLVESGRYLRLMPLKKLAQMPLKIFRGLEEAGDVRPGEIVTVVMDLKHMDASEVAEAVAPMLSNAGSIAALTRGRGLILTDRLSNIQRVRQLLTELDTESTVQRQMKTHVLLHASGALVANLLNRTFGEATARKRTEFNPQTKKFEELAPDPADYVTAVFDEASRTLVLFGPRDRIALAEQLIQEFEDKGGARAGEVRIYHPQTTEVMELADMIRQAVPGVATQGEAPATAATKARVIVDAPRKRLIVTAPIAGQLEAIEKVVQQVDGATSSETIRPGESLDVTRVFRLQNAEPISVAQAITNALATRLPSGAMISRVQLTVDPATQAVIVTGSSADLLQAAEIVKQLDSDTGLAADLQTRLIDIGSATEVQRLAPLIQQLYKDLAGPGQSRQASRTKIVPEPESGRLIVTATAEHQRKIDEIIKQLKAAPLQKQPRRLQIIELTEVKVDQAQKNITDLVKQKMTEKRFQDLPEPVLLPDAANNRLLVNATDDQFKEIQLIVRMLDVPDPRTAQPRQLQIIEFQKVKVDQVLKNVTDLVKQRMAEKRFQNLPEPLLLPDPPNNRLLVTATEEQIKEIQQVVGLFDVADSRPVRQMALIPLQIKPAAEVLPLVTDLMSQMAQDRPAQAKGQLPPKLIADPSGKQLIVLATPEELEEIRRLVQQFDGKAEAKAARQLRAIDVHGRTASELSPLVQQLYQEQIRGMQEPAGGPATVLAEPKANQIMVSGSEQEIARVEVIVRQLDPAGRPGAKEETRVIRLVSALASELAGLVEKSLNTPREQVKVLVDTRSNSLVVTGNPDVVAAAAQIIQQLDAKPQLQPRELRIIELKTAEADKIVPMVTDLLAETLKEQRGPNYVTQTKLTPDTAADRIIATGARDELAQVTALVEQIDQAPQQGVGARVFELKSADARVLAPIVSNSMVTFDSRNQPINRVTVAADEKSNSLVVSGSRKDLQDAASIIEKLDSKVQERFRALKVMEVGSEEPGELARLALQIFATENKGRNDADRINITPDPSGKRLVVMAPDLLIRQVEEVITALDHKPDGGARQLELIELKHTSPQELIPIVTKVYEEQTRGTATKRATLFQEGANRLAIFGSPEQLAVVKQLVSTLDAAPGGTARELELIELKRATPQELLPVVTRVYEEQARGKATTSRATLFAEGTRLAVFGPKEEIATVKQLVATLEEQGAMPPWETKTFELGRLADVQRLQPLTQQLYRDQMKNIVNAGPADAQFMSDGKTGRLIVSARRDHLAQIERILAGLRDGTLEQPGRVTRSFDLGAYEEVERLTPLVQQLYQDQWQDRKDADPADAKILSDAQGGRIIVTGRPDHVKEIETILTQLRAGEAKVEPLETRVYDLKTSSATELATNVNSLYREQLRTRPRAAASQTLILPDTASNRLIVSGRSNEVSLVEGIIRQLDDARAQSGRSRAFKLKHAQADNVATVLSNTLVQYDTYGRPTQKVSVGADKKSNTVIVYGDIRDVQSAALVIEQLDATAEKAPRVLRLLPVKSMAVAELATKVKLLSRPRSNPCRTPARPKRSFWRMPRATS